MRDESSSSTQSMNGSADMRPCEPPLSNACPPASSQHFGYTSPISTWSGICLPTKRSTSPSPSPRVRPPAAGSTQRSRPRSATGVSIVIRPERSRLFYPKKSRDLGATGEGGPAEEGNPRLSRRSHLKLNMTVKRRKVPAVAEKLPLAGCPKAPGSRRPQAFCCLPPL